MEKFTGRKGSLSKMYSKRRWKNGENRKVKEQILTVELDHPIGKVLG
jgi:hypothetical protein